MYHSLIDNIDMKTIYKGTECHLYDLKYGTISSSPFIASGDINVLVSKGYGPLHDLLYRVAHPKGVSKHETFDLVMEETKNMARNLPLIHHFVGADEEMNLLLQDIADEFPEADAILMAVTNTNKIALYYIRQGDIPDISKLR